MNTAPTANPTELMTQHFTILREYGRRVLMNEEELLPDEEQDKSVRMNEFIAIGTSYRCTEKEMVGLLYKGIIL